MFSAVLIATVLLLHSQTSQQQRTDDKGIIQGTVTRAGTGDPVVGAQVRLTDPAAVQRLVDLFSAQGVTIALPANGAPDEAYAQRLLELARTRGVSTTAPAFQSALTAFREGNATRFSVASDSAGRFVIRDVPPGTYTVRAEREGYFGGTVNNAANTTATSTAVVTAGGNTAVSISLIAGATISGKVVIDGVPQIGANVQAFSITYQNGYQVMQPVVSKATDDRGNYRLFFLPPGEYLVAALPRQAGRPTLVTAGTADASNPMQLVRTFYPGTADSASALPLRTRGSEEIPGIDVAIRTEKTYKVSGRVINYIPLSALQGQVNSLGRGTAPPNPIVSADVAFALHDPDVPDDLGGRTIGQIQLRPSGNSFSADFEVSGVLPGSYDWRASVYEIPADGVLQPSTAIIPIEVRGGDVTGLVLELHQTVSVTGAVTIDGSAPSRAPVKVWLQVEGASAKRPGYQQIASRIVTVDAQTGNFTIPGIQMGRFRLMLGSGLSPDLYIEDVRQAGQSVFDAGFVIAHDSPSPIQVSLRSGAGTVEGAVLDASKKPVSGATVALIPPAASRQNRARYQTATSDASGRFLIRNVIPGDYKVFAWPDVAGGAYFNARFLSRHEERGRAVHVGQSSTTTVDISADF